MHCPACDHDNIPGTDLCDHCGLDLAGLEHLGKDLDPEDPLLARPLGELTLQEPILLPPGATVLDALRAMHARHYGCVFVQDSDGALVGVFTERDAVSRVAARHRDPATVPLRDVMTPRPYALRREDPLAWALNRMGVEGQRQVPVVADGDIVGFLTVQVVLEALL